MQVPGLVESLISLLREKIIIGEFEPGQNINELELSKSLDISRSPLREALKVLEKEGLINNIPRKGSFVSGISLEDLFEIYQMREMIESYAIDLFGEAGVQSHGDLYSCVEHMKDLEVPSEESSPRDKLNYIESLAEFHMELVRATGNQRLFDYYKTIHSNINRYVFLHAFVSGVLEHRVDEHFKVLEYLQLGQYGKAKETLKSHIRRSYEDLRSRIN